MKLMIIHPLPSRKNARADQIAKYLSKLGHEVHLILWDVPYPTSLFFKNFFSSLRYKKYMKEGVIIYKTRRLPFFFPAINNPWFQNQIKNIFHENNIDLIISQSFINETCPPFNLPFVYDLMDEHEAYAKIYGSFLYKKAFKILQVHETVENQIKKAKKVIVVSEMLKEYATKFNSKCYKIPNGVDSWALKNKFKRKKYNFGKHSLVYVSGFDYWAQLPQLIHTIAEIKKDIPDIKLILVGDGYQIPEGKKIVKELNLEENVIFFGQINDRKELFEIINSCDVCLNLSEKNKIRDSASPIKVFEYSALGKPIISAKLTEVESLKFPNIIFYKENNNTSLVEAIKKAFKKKVNQNKIKKLISRYTWENIAKEFEKIILGCIK